MSTDDMFPSRKELTQWAGELVRAEETSNIKREPSTYNTPTCWTPKKNMESWEGGVRESLEFIGIRQDWQNIAQDRLEWRRLVWEVKDLCGL
ncbi:hypothetical protein M8J77_002231 [Diaphorina citri]|nr:hypothetical protein M8J77_002231 [Diaphorina citri]